MENNTFEADITDINDVKTKKQRSYLLKGPFWDGYRWGSIKALICFLLIAIGFGIGWYAHKVQVDQLCSELYSRVMPYYINGHINLIN